MKLIRLATAMSMVFPAFSMNVRTQVVENAPAVGTIRGSVFDSLTMQVLAGASVFVAGTSRTALSDKAGRFEIDSVPVGKQVLAFSFPALDSAGLGIITVAVNVTSENSSQVKLTTPSFLTVWRFLCSGNKKVGSDSGITWGTVRDAVTDVRQGGAAVRFNWFEMRIGKDKKPTMTEFNAEVRTDSTGTFYACGLPRDIEVSTEAEGTSSSTGVIQYGVGSRGLNRMDLLVSTDMVALPTTKERTTEETAAAMKAHGTSIVRGFVRDEKGKAQAKASVLLMSVDTTVLTNDAGEFTLAGMPAGTHQIGARQVGFAPVRAVVDLHPGATTNIDLVLSSAHELEAVNVRSERTSGADRRDYEMRRREGFGYGMDETTIKNRPDIESVLRGSVAAVTVYKYKGNLTILFPNGSLFGAKPCSAVLWIDGRRVTAEEVSAMSPTELRAVEVFPHAGSAPPQYSYNSACGVILFWTKLSRW